MTTEEKVMRAWIDNADYESLLRRWRFTSSNSPELCFFQGETGDYYKKIMAEKEAATPASERVRISKSLGW